MLEFQEVSITYKTHGRRSQPRLEAVASASMSCPEGKICALIGPSGCGKTSLIQAAAGLKKIDGGTILVAGRPVSGTRRQTAVIFQDFGLLPWKTVEENVALPLLIRRMPRSQRLRRVHPILAEMGLLEFKSFFPLRLSGGMRQRVAIARALASEPDLLLMDEPFSSLDAITREGLQENLLEVARHRRMSVLVVTHSTEEAAFLADRIYVMQGRVPGRIVACVESEVDPRSDGQPAARAASFRGSARYFELCVELRRSLGVPPTTDRSAGGLPGTGMQKIIT